MTVIPSEGMPCEDAWLLDLLYFKKTENFVDDDICTICMLAIDTPDRFLINCPQKQDWLYNPCHLAISLYLWHEQRSLPSVMPAKVLVVIRLLLD
ncbi:hypothetical protein PHYBLDRAFT_144969 [Phycomyces blakesleeanus NRRL 1555(-)]|uniref:Uncharacterized protein n=1 Tax=Phycomyces blakesleeanus (strain ATCC 8743b / DSM 1359 / FGSC 10004 / NBRC 33097 / NRRL 1555) TaxID=763407 RepID=A0A163E0B1_PHYB8|nr:hypothetical protein PHYBLDRAFT_144969 [Phycomyces blakesleeanus NRRL 1555(-)]OAD74530.1 hypothetical protein PHYBLDRAFT_144969 [Phycomyces blakesleeanus NRRL 1555(-)]|eukprot:XP_018292570.1 hypothetical protein PHYBLDRAFT_144969 [Phycomyces blakesleeanus NRRL 1555(-)]